MIIDKISDNIQDVITTLQKIPFFLDELEYECINKTHMKSMGASIQKTIMECRSNIFNVSMDVREYRKGLIKRYDIDEEEAKKQKRIAELEAELASLR